MPESPLLAADVSAHPANRPSRVKVQPWPSERPLFLLSLAVSVVLWLVLTVTIVGLLYAAMIAAFVFIGHVLFITHVRGSGVRLGPDQLPELHARVTTIAAAIGLERVPDVYLLQAGGALNALATRLFGTHFVILFSDLLEACGDDDAARDMIIAHELGHVKSGHLRWHWVLLPSMIVPFLGGALSRAREYSCDRFGLAGAGDRDGALLGLTILAAGGTHARRINRDALVRQRADLNTGWMRIGEWMGSHPPLARRLAALDPALGAPAPSSASGTVRALMIVVSGFILLVAMGLAFVRVASFAERAIGAGAGAGVATVPIDAEQGLEDGFREISAFLSAEVAAGRALPETMPELANRWQMARPADPIPLDPYDGAMIGYALLGEEYVLFSSGPDGIGGTDDDIPFRPQAD